MEIPEVPEKGFLEDLEWFESLLSSEGISIKPNSPLEKELHQIRITGESQATAELEEMGLAVPEWLRRGYGIAFLLRSLRRASFSEAWQALKTHFLKYLSGKDVSLVEMPKRNQQRDYMWEFLIGALLAEFCDDVKPEEPDLQCTYNKIRYGVACKIAYSHDKDRQVDAIVHGAKQIESSTCDFGVIIVNCTPLLDHHSYFPLAKNATTDNVKFDGFEGARVVDNKIRNDIHTISKRICDSQGLWDRIGYDKSGKPRQKTRMLAFYAQTVAPVRQHGRHFPTLFTLARQISFRKIHVVGGESRFLENFNISSAKALFWQP